IGAFPDWYAPPQPDWPASSELTSFPLWDERGVTESPAEVNEFLAAGDPPIAFTPGSAMLQGEKFFAAAADACRRLGRRGMLLSRHAQQIPARLPDGVRHFAYAPFSEILPRCAALVHHGGIGTLSQALAAGVPQLVMPMAHDQPDNAARVRRLGVGSVLWPSQFRGPRVAAALAALLASAEVKANCDACAEHLADVDGLGLIADALERRFC
ncbi:MAG: glycosyltransferase, partial [Planctomycetales bacterium]|nr:glycosyltransferase [Planctomycetales bacterium]